MKISFRHPLPVSAQQAWEAFNSDAYERDLQAQPSAMTRELVEEGEEGGKPMKRWRITGQELPAMGRKAFGIDRLVYDQIEIYDDANQTMTWRVLPSAMADKVTAEGVYRLIDTAKGCDRITEGTIEVRIRMVGGAIEKAIGDQLGQAMDKGAQFFKGWLEKNVA